MYEAQSNRKRHHTMSGKHAAMFIYYVLFFNFLSTDCLKIQQPLSFRTSHSLTTPHRQTNKQKHTMCRECG